MKIPGPDHPIIVTPTEGRVTAQVGDRTIAETTAALGLAEADYPVVQYIPISDVEPGVLRPTDTSTHCPYKGDASYYSIELAGQEWADAAWSYLEPHPAVADIAGYVAFYPDKVQVTVEAR